VSEPSLSRAPTGKSDPEIIPPKRRKPIFVLDDEPESKFNDITPPVSTGVTDTPVETRKTKTIVSHEANILRDKLRNADRRILEFARRLLEAVEKHDLFDIVLECKARVGIGG
jgi:hypothetical protein